MVVVFTANITSGSNPEHDLLFDYIIPAVINDTNTTTTPFEFDILLPTLLIALMIPVIAAILLVRKRRKWK